MPDKKITYLLIDTSYLRGVGFNHPDFRKLLHFSKEDVLKIFIPHIAWEERRTQLRDDACGEVRALNTAFEKVSGLLTKNIVFGGLIPPTLHIWSEAEIDANSKETMTAFARENKVEIVSLAPDHAERAWQRYFNASLPFKRDEKRENRRKDIPDSWIFEAAIDLAKKHPGLLALCGDDKLSGALNSIDVKVFKDAQHILDAIDQSLAPEPIAPTAQSQEIELTEDVGERIAPESKLETMLARVREQFKDLDTKILGYVGYLGSPAKDQIFTLLAQSGVSIEISKNVAERLVIAGVITDTGNHYLPGNKEAGDSAAASVEAEIIKLLET